MNTIELRKYTRENGEIGYMIMNDVEQETDDGLMVVPARTRIPAAIAKDLIGSTAESAIITIDVLPTPDQAHITVTEDRRTYSDLMENGYDAGLPAEYKEAAMKKTRAMGHTWDRIRHAIAIRSHGASGTRKAQISNDLEKADLEWAKENGMGK